MLNLEEKLSLTRTCFVELFSFKDNNVENLFCIDLKNGWGHKKLMIIVHLLMRKSAHIFSTFYFGARETNKHLDVF